MILDLGEREYIKPKKRAVSSIVICFAFLRSHSTTIARYTRRVCSSQLNKPLKMEKAMPCHFSRYRCIISNNSVYRCIYILFCIRVYFYDRNGRFCWHTSFMFSTGLPASATTTTITTAAFCH